MKKGNLLRRVAITLAMAMLMATACGGEEPPGGKERTTAPGEARATVPDATRTPPPIPTRPGRIDYLLRTPTVTPKPAVKQGTKPERSQTSGAERGTESNGARTPGETHQPKGIAALVPEDPRTNDQVLLQDIYAQVDLEQFALDPNEPIEFRRDKYRAWILSQMSHPLVHQHPYLHIFPALEEIAEVLAKAGRTNDFVYAPTSWARLLSGGDTRLTTEEREQTLQTSFWDDVTGSGSRQRPDISAGSSRMTYFIYHPWFEPVFFRGESHAYRSAEHDPLSYSAQKEIGKYNLQGTGPYWFGNNSTRGVLSETVAALLEKAVRPGGSEPTQREWWPKDHREHRQYLFGEKPEPWDWTMEEYIRTTTSVTGKDKPDSWEITSHATPQVEWEIIHPELPILKITAHAQQTLPLVAISSPTPARRITSDMEADYKRFKRGKGNLTEEESTERFLEQWNSKKMNHWRAENRARTKYSVSFVMSLQHRWTSFQDPNRWIVRFKEDMALYWPPHHVPDEEAEITKELRRMEEDGKFVFPPEWGRYPHYWHNTDYMQHRIIGPVVLTVHESTALQPGNYSMAPRIGHWEAPGHILTDEQLRKMPRYRITEPGPEPKNPDDDGVILWPQLWTPNAGFPLPGHVLVGPQQGPGTEPWREYGMEGYDW